MQNEYKQNLQGVQPVQGCLVHPTVSKEEINFKSKTDIAITIQTQPN